MAEKTTGPIERELRIRNDELRARIEQIEKRNVELDSESAAAHRIMMAGNAALSREREERLRLEVEAQRLSAENAGLRQDRERIDWIDANLGAFEQMLNDDNLQLEVDLRMAIDAARGAK